MTEQATPPEPLLKAIETVRVLRLAFRESWEGQSRSIEELDDAGDIAKFTLALSELGGASNGLYMAVALAAVILNWASGETGRSGDEILDFIRKEIEIWSDPQSTTGAPVPGRVPLFGTTGYPLGGGCQ